VDGGGRDRRRGRHRRRLDRRHLLGDGACSACRCSWW
jgi:hypothetical protein